MSIFKLKPACKDYIWGGTRLKTEYFKDFGGERLAETWELSCHKDGLSIIADGAFKGLSLKEYADKYGAAAIGSVPASFKEFPLLIKFIDAKDDLSIQVHPDDEYAEKYENSLGKTEMWYVLDADPGACIYYGTNREISREEFAERIENNSVTEVLKKIPAKKGDCFFIPAGTLHAICSGLLIAEIQQSSNITYRVYDYGRLGADGKPRALHTEKAMETASLVPVNTDFDFGNHLASCKYFTVDLLCGDFSLNAGTESFISLLVADGEGKLQGEDRSISIKKGDSIFVSAGSGKLDFSGSAEILCTRVLKDY